MTLSLYLDCCALQRPFDDRSQLRVATEAEAVLKLIEFFEASELVLLSSGALLFEVGRIQASERHNYCLELLNRCTNFVAFTNTIRERANSYSQEGIKPMDALHLASAVAGGATYFCSCDDRFLSRAKLVETGLTQVVSVLELVEKLKE
ncbi:MAG: PIN domain-containing protein [Verrucomicrobia bacterium]|jgi:predicted nucleic acid-binding protein|nr:PIN domain-containing protein [Verrucomicrobiota bacterium]